MLEFFEQAESFIVWAIVVLFAALAIAHDWHQPGPREDKEGR